MILDGQLLGMSKFMTDARVPIVVELVNSPRKFRLKLNNILYFAFRVVDIC
jgi:hypothetical protein